MVSEQNHAFFIPIHDSFFTEYGHYLSIHTIKQTSALFFKDHLEWPVLVDTLSRQYQHHITLKVDFSPQWHTYLLETLLIKLNHENTPKLLREADLIYFEHLPATFSKNKQLVIKKSFQQLREALDNATHTVIFAFYHQLPDNHFLHRQFQSLFTHPKCRLLVLTSHPHHSAEYTKPLTYLSFSAPTTTDHLHRLKQYRCELENFHHVVIPEELLTQAYTLAKRYLHARDTAESARCLLDSSTARASALFSADHQHSSKPVLTSTTLTQVLSEWTHIPASHLSSTKFKLSDFIQGMQQHLFNQEAAITLLGQELQQAHSKLLPANSPFCKLLFVGPPHSGKKAAALALAEQLFKQPHVLYTTALPTSSTTSLAEIRLQRYTDGLSFSLKEIADHLPYAIIVFENIEHAAPNLLDGLHEIVSTGYLNMADGQRYAFHQAIVIITLTLQADHLKEVASSFAEEEEVPDIDLRHLVMNEYKHQSLHSSHHYAPQDLAYKMLNKITARIPHSLCQQLAIVPFIPLNKTALEKIIRLKLNQLRQSLNVRYHIAMNYAPEVLRYLVHLIWIKREIAGMAINLEPALKQIYFVIEQAISQQGDNKNRLHQLFLQLDETGQLLRCDWLPMTAASL